MFFARTPKSRLIAAGAAAIAAGTLALAPTAAKAETTCANRNAPTASTPVAAIEDAILCMTNNERVARGLPALHSNTTLRTAARAHSEDMVARNFDSHVNPDGKGPNDRMTAAGYSWDWWGENIGNGFTTPAQMVAWWMQSPGHRDNILSANFEEIGIGVAHGSPVRYTMKLASPTGAVGNGPTGLEASFQDAPSQDPDPDPDPEPQPQPPPTPSPGDQPQPGADPQAIPTTPAPSPSETATAVPGGSDASTAPAPGSEPPGGTAPSTQRPAGASTVTTIAGRTARLTRRGLAIRLRCTTSHRTRRCAGALAITVRRGRFATFTARKTFTLRSRSTRTVNVAISRRQRRALPRPAGRRTSVRATVTTRNPGDFPTRRTAALRLAS
jgi:uncharacterized protein YkwD/outer membrane biosynthesis protein TonB